MPGPLADANTAQPTSTQTALSYESHIRREIIALRAGNTPDPVRVLSRLLSSTISPQASSQVLRAMRDAVQARLASNTGEESALYDVALAALDSFIAVRIRGARSKASAFFDQLCRERTWTSLALFSASTVAEAAFLAVNSPRKRLTVIDSAPGYEGRVVAKRLGAATGVPVRYGLLASCHKLLDGIDALVIGAEEVTMNGAIVAAPGASVVVQMARELGVCVVVATQAVKFSEGIVVDFTYGDYDVIKAHEVMSVVTEMDTGTWSVAASAPEVLKRYAASAMGA